MKNSWYFLESQMCSSDGTPIRGIPSHYVLCNEKKERICDVNNIEDAMLIASAPELKAFVKRFIAGDLSVLEEAKSFMKNFPEPSCKARPSAMHVVRDRH